MPNFVLLESIENDVLIPRVAVCNHQSISRINLYGYKNFRGEKIEIKQIVNQYTTFVSTDWGQKLIFEAQPKKGEVFYYFIYDLASTKYHYFYPNGKWRSRFKRLFSVLNRVSYSSNLSTGH